MNIEERDYKSYIQDAHLRYIIDYYSSGEGFGSRKVYLIFHLGLTGIISIILLWIFPNFNTIIGIIIALIIYLYGKEIGRRDGYIKAYKSLLEYDNEHLSRWQELQVKENKKLDITHTEACKNTEKILSTLDFTLKDDFANEEE